MYPRLVVLCVHVPQVGGIVRTCTSGWWYCVYMYPRLVVLCVHVLYLKLVVLCVHVPQVGSIVCTCVHTSLIYAHSMLHCCYIVDD